MHKTLALAVCALGATCYLAASPAQQETTAKETTAKKTGIANADVTVIPVLKAKQSWNAKPIVYPEGEAEIRVLVIEIAPGGQTGWHLHQVPSFAMLLAGELEVQLKDGRVKKVNAGEGLAEVVNTLHNGRSVGDVPAKLVVFYAGTAGQTLTIKESELDGRN